MRWGGPLRWSWVLVAGPVLWASLATAQSPDFEAGRRLFHQVEYGKAIEALERSLRARPSREEKLEIYLLLAKAYRAVGRSEAAVGAFRSLLQLDPAHRLSPEREPPSLIELFEQARQQEVSTGPAEPPKILHTPVSRGYGGLGVTFHAQILHLRPEHQAWLFFRQIGQLRYQRLDFTRREGSRFVATIPGTALQRRVDDYLLEYYLAVTDAIGEVVAQVGREERPLTMRVVLITRPPPRQAVLAAPAPWYRRHWWLWVVLGAVVVGGAVTAATLAR